MSGKARHLAGAAIGLMSIPAMAFLVIRGVYRRDFLALEVLWP